MRDPARPRRHFLRAPPAKGRQRPGHAVGAPAATRKGEATGAYARIARLRSLTEEAALGWLRFEF